MPDPLIRAVEAFLHQHRVHDQLLIVGVSGGADSQALLHSLNRLSGAYGLRLCAAHLNHELRGDESERDAEFVETLARAWQIPVVVESHDVAAFARAKKLSTEEAARMVRYGFLEQVAEREGAAAVAVAHNADDQVETILMHFLRGAGLAGLRGMQPTAHYPFRPPLRLLRPLLNVNRAAIEAYCAAHQLTPREDTTNADLKFMRNRVRRELLPLLESYNPNIRAVLRRNAHILAADYEYLRQRARGAFERTVLESRPDTVAYSLAGWRILQPSLKRALIRSAVMHLRPVLRNLEAQHVEEALHVADHGCVGARAPLPQGLWLFRDFDAIVIGEKLETPDLPQAPAQPIALNVPGHTRLDQRWQIEAKLLKRDELPSDALLGIDPLETFLDADKVRGALCVRARAASDVFRPLGLNGHSKPLRRFMIDAKVPAHWRETTPIVAADGDVSWVVGWRIAETVKIDAHTQRVLRLKFVRTIAE